MVLATLCRIRTYLAVLPQRARRRALAQLRTGAHWLAEETGRWQRQERQQRMCMHCSALGRSTLRLALTIMLHAFALLRCVPSAPRRPLPVLHSFVHTTASSWPDLPVLAIALATSSGTVCAPLTLTLCLPLICCCCCCCCSRGVLGGVTSAGENEEAVLGEIRRSAA
jgi:hypothetical protein